MLRTWQISWRATAGTLPKFVWARPRGGRKRRCKLLTVLPPIFVVVRASSTAANAVATVGTHKITTVGRDKFLGTEMPGALAGIIAGEQGYSAAASRA